MSQGSAPCRIDHSEDEMNSTRTLRWADNPYALAEVLLGEPIDWDDLCDRRKARDQLVELFGISDINALFRGATERDPMPTVLHLFRCVQYSPRGYRTVKEALDDARNQYPEAYAALRARLRDRPLVWERLRWLVPWLVPVSDDDAPGDATPGRADESLTAPTQVKWDDEGPGAGFELLVSDADFRDPMQGVIPDCSLIASMTALAWVDPEDWKARIEAAKSTTANQKLTFVFFEDGEPSKHRVSRKLPFARQVIPYARSRTKTESWPTLYEKAFVVKQSGVGASEPQAFDYNQLDRIKPDAAFATLTGLPSQDSITSPAFAHVEEHCTDPVTVADGGRSSRSKEPLAAWTYSSDDEEFDEAKRHFSEDSQLVSDHCYTVLGSHRTAGGESFVLLRNPWGKKPTVPNRKFMKGDWLTGRDEPAMDRIPVGPNGVIGVPVDIFNTCFDGVAWSKVE